VNTPQCDKTQYDCYNSLYSSTPINSILKDTGETGVRYLLAVNVDPFPVTASFNFPSKVITKVTSVFDSRNVSFSGGSFTDPFPDYGTALYRIQDSSYVTPGPSPTPTVSPSPAPAPTTISDLRLAIKNFADIFGYNTVVKNYGGLPVNFPTTNLFAYYKSDELTGTTMIDSVGGKNGITNTGVTIVDGKLNKGKQYTRSNNGYGEIADPAFNFEWNKPISISVWVKPTSLASYNQILNRGTVGVGAYALRLDNGKPAFYLAGTSILTAGAYRQATSPISSGNWTHIISTYDGSGDSGGIKLYINGALASSASLHNNSFAGKTILNSSPVRIGRAAADGENFDGVIDEIGIWDRALTASEVSTLYNGGAGVAY
jgi:hypothetical protein